MSRQNINFHGNKSKQKILPQQTMGDHNQITEKKQHRTYVAIWKFNKNREASK